MADVGQQYSKKFRLFHLLSNILRLLYHQASYAVTHGGFLFHLIAATNGVLIVDDELPAVSVFPPCAVGSKPRLLFPFFSLLPLLSLLTLFSVLSYFSNQTLKSATVGNGFVPSERAGKVVFGLRKHNLACSRNYCFSTNSAFSVNATPIAFRFGLIAHNLRHCSMSSSYMAMWWRQMFSSSPVTLIRRVSDRRRTIWSSFWRTSSLTNTGRRLTILGT